MRKTKSFGVAAVLSLLLTVSALAGDIPGGKAAVSFGDIPGGKSVAATGDIPGGKAKALGDIPGGIRATILTWLALLGI